TRLLREVRPRVVLTHSPADYMLDHEMTSALARAAAFAAPVPNFLSDRGHPPHLEHIPHLYYCDAIEGKDLFGREVPADFRVDVTPVIEAKAEMLACHASQRDWLLKHHGMDQYVETMREWGRRRGREHGAAYAEGFRQHLGHGYPQHNLLGRPPGSADRGRQSVPEAHGLLTTADTGPRPLRSVILRGVLHGTDSHGRPVMPAFDRCAFLTGCLALVAGGLSPAQKPPPP